MQKTLNKPLPLRNLNSPRKLAQQCFPNWVLSLPLVSSRPQVHTLTGILSTHCLVQQGFQELEYDSHYTVFLSEIHFLKVVKANFSCHVRTNLSTEVLSQSRLSCINMLFIPICTKTVIHYGCVFIQRRIRKKKYLGCN